MKRVGITLLCILIVSTSFSQINFLIKPKNGESFIGEYQNKTNENITLKKGKNEITLSYNDIEKIQTLGVHFIQDAYTNELAGGKKILEFDKVGEFGGWGIYISVRSIDTNIFLLFKFKWLIHNDEDYIRNVITENEDIIFTLSNGTFITLKLTNPYVLQGYDYYNFGYVNLNTAEYKLLISASIKQITYRGEECKVKDDYTIMRQLFALLDEGMLWRF